MSSSLPSLPFPCPSPSTQLCSAQIPGNPVCVYPIWARKMYWPFNGIQCRHFGTLHAIYWLTFSLGDQGSGEPATRPGPVPTPGGGFFSSLPSGEFLGHVSFSQNWPRVGIWRLNTHLHTVFRGLVLLICQQDVWWRSVWSILIGIVLV